MARPWVLVFGLVLVIATTVFLILQGDITESPGTPSAQVTPPLFETAGPATDPADLRDGESTPPAWAPEKAKPAEKAATAADPATLAQEHGGIHIQGRVIVRDRDGIDHTDATGTIKLSVPRPEGKGGSIETVNVSDGRWSVILRHGDTLGVRDIQLGGRRATHDLGRARIPVTADEVFVIRAIWTHSTLLHVVDVDTRAALTRIEVIDVPRDGSNDATHPGLSLPRVRHTSAGSPIEIDAPRRSDTAYLVRAEGYAWERVLMHDQGGERTVGLQREGGLRVRLEHDGDTPAATLRLYVHESNTAQSAMLLEGLKQAVAALQKEGRVQETLNELEQTRESLPPEGAGMVDFYAALLRGEEPSIRDYDISGLVSEAIGEPMCEILIGERDFVDLDSLQSGPYLVRVETGESYDNPTVLAESTAHVISGEVASATLTWQRPEEIEPARLRGCVVYGSAWHDCDSIKTHGFRRAHIEFNGKSAGGSMRARDVELGPPYEQGGDWRCDWDAGEVEAGSYSISLGGFHRTTRVDLAPGDDGSSEIRVGDPARVRVSIVDPWGRLVTAETLSWFTAGTLRGRSAETVRPEDSSVFEFCAPVGRITVAAVGSRGYRVSSATHDLAPGDNEITLEAIPTYEVTIVLRDGDTIVPMPDPLRTKARALEGKGRLVSYAGRHPRFTLSHAGLYRFTIEDIPGYRPIPPQEIRVGPDPKTTHDVYLDPLR